MRFPKHGYTHPRGHIAVLAALVLSMGLISDSVWSQTSGEITESPMRMADQLAADGNYADAIPLYRQAHDQHSSRHGPLLGLGRSLMALGQYDEALRSLLAAKKRDEGNSEVLEALGTNYLILGDLVEARLTLEASRSRGGGSASLFASLGTTLAALGEMDLAVGAFDEGLLVYSDDPDLNSNKGLILALSGDLADGIALLEQAAASTGSQMEHRLNLAFGYVVAGNIDRARRMASVDLDVHTVADTLSVYEEIAAMAPADRIQALLYGSSNPRHDLEKLANFIPSLDPEETAAAVARILNPPPPPQPPVLIGPYLVFFEFDKSDILDDARAVIEEAAREFAANNMAEFLIDGHADRAGSDPYNLALSDRRATAVKEVLVGLGIDEAMIVAIGHGEHQQLIETVDEVREPQNRRVLLTLKR